LLATAEREMIMGADVPVTRVHDRKFLIRIRSEIAPDDYRGFSKFAPFWSIIGRQKRP
jgi:hypothetical protein